MSELELDFDPHHTFVGEEFLTWLWWQCETTGGVFDLGGGHAISMAIEDNLVLRGDASEDEEDILRGGVPTRSQEAAVALATGKRLGRAKIVLATEDREWTVTFDGSAYLFAGAKVPQPGKDDDPDVEAFMGFADLAETFDQLLGQFLRLRLSPKFGKETLPAMRKWVAKKVGG